MSSFLGCIGAASLVAALLLVIALPSLERLGGTNGGAVATVSSHVLLLLAAVTGWLDGADASRVVAATAAALLVWGLMMFGLFRGRRSRASTDQAAMTAAGPGRNCKSRLTSGAAMTEGPKRETWRSYLFTFYSTTPSDGQLAERAKAWGGAYYVLYYSSGEVEVTPHVDIVCEHTKDGKCLADGSEKGSTGLPDPPVRVQIANNISSQDDRVRVAVTMSAALNASGGPSIAITPGGIGPTVSFPDASLDAPFAMGTYRWICDKVEG